MVGVDDVGPIAACVVVESLPFITASRSVFASAVHVLPQSEHCRLEQKHFVGSAGDYKPHASAAHPRHRARGGGGGTDFSPFVNEYSLGNVGGDSCRRHLWFSI